MVTTCHRAGYEQYGPRMLETFLTYWPEDFAITIVSEDQLDLPDNPRVLFEDYEALVPEGNHFKRKFGRFSEANGRMYLPKDDRPDSEYVLQYNYLYDAIKWSHKVFAIFGVSRKVDCDRLIWLDADNYTFKEIDEAFLNGVDPGNGHMGYLGRDHMYSECSFLIFNKRHPTHDPFMTQIVAEYLNGEMFLLDEWHDCKMWDIMREYFSKEQNTAYHNISGDARSSDHPFVNSIIGKYMDHLKGPDRKAAGRSFNDDYQQDEELV